MTTPSPRPATAARAARDSTPNPAPAAPPVKAAAAVIGTASAIVPKICLGFDKYALATSKPDLFLSSQAWLTSFLPS